MNTLNVSVPPLPATVATIPSASEAYLHMHNEYESFPEDQVVPLNVDIPTVALKMVAHVEPVLSLLPEAKAKWKDFDEKPFLRLGVVAMGMLHAHDLHVTAAAPVTDDLVSLQEAGNQRRVQLLDTAQYLGRNGQIDLKRLEPVRSLAGYRNLANDLRWLVQILRDAGSEVLGKSAVTTDDLDKATAIAERLFAAVSLREQTQKTSAQTAIVRQKAYSLACREYDYIRSVVSFLRWKQDDADDFAPSLFSGRNTGRREPKIEATPAPAAPGGSHAAPAGGAPASPFSPSAPSSKELPVPVGHEGGSPFIS